MLSPGRTPSQEKPGLSDADDGVGRAMKVFFLVDDLAAEDVLEEGDHLSEILADNVHMIE